MPLLFEDGSDARSRAFDRSLELNRHLRECANLARPKRERPSRERYPEFPGFSASGYGLTYATTRLDEYRILVREAKHGLGQA